MIHIYNSLQFLYNSKKLYVCNETSYICKENFMRSWSPEVHSTLKVRKGLIAHIQFLL